MSRISAELWVPAAGIRQDLEVPYEMRLHQTVELLKAMLADLENNGFAPDETSVLCDAETGAMFNVNLTPEELALENGCRLMMV